MLRGDINWNEFERHAGYPIAEAKYLQTLMELVSMAGENIASVFVWKAARSIFVCVHI